jgi:hypothetical protein
MIIERRKELAVAELSERAQGALATWRETLAQRG